jgi:hypothetical protein
MDPMKSVLFTTAEAAELADIKPALLKLWEKFKPSIQGEVAGRHDLFTSAKRIFGV